MNITEDKTTYAYDTDFLERGLAYIAPLKVCFRARDPKVNIRIMEAINRDFKVYQYVHEREGGVPYNSGWDFFFWCYAMGDRQMDYFTLSSHEDNHNAEHNRTLAEREADYERLRSYLETNFANEDCEVVFEYHTEEDAHAIIAGAKRIFAELGNNGWCEYKGMQGRLCFSEKHGYYFKKKGAKKMGYILDYRKMCYVRKWEKNKENNAA